MKKHMNMHRGQADGLAITLLAFIIIALAIAGGCYAIPRWNVWNEKLQGEAEFARAEQNRRIRIEEAKANLEAEKMNAAAEVERAKGAAQAIEIENGKLTATYIQYLWVRQQNLANNKVIYIPTEACLPVLEAGKRGAEKKGEM